MGWLEDVYKVIKDLFLANTTSTKGTLSGQVLDQKNRPVHGAILTLDDGTSIHTAQDGSFALMGLVGTFRISVSYQEQVHKDLTIVLLQKNQHKEGVVLVLPETQRAAQNTTLLPTSTPAPTTARPEAALDDVIRETEGMFVDDVAKKKVLCPLCKEHVFQVWPFGWDGHAESKCRGLVKTCPDGRKEEYKSRLIYLFRPNFTIYGLRTAPSANDEVVQPLLFQELLSGRGRFGWSYRDDGSLTALKNLESEELGGNQEWQEIWKNGKFLLEIQPNDFVVYINLPNKGDCSVARVTGAYSLDEGIECEEFGSYAEDNRDFRHCLPVEYLGTFERNDTALVPSQLSKKLKLRNKHWRITEKHAFLAIIKHLQATKR